MAGETGARVALLALVRDPEAMRRLVRRHGDGWRALEEEALAARVEQEGEAAVRRRVEAAFAALAQGGIAAVAPGDADWPARVDVAPSPPLLLFVKGRLPDPERCPSLAIVGSRRNAAYGERVAASFARGWVAMGGAVVSGGALGVDAAAHRAALDAGGPTVAVLAGGVDRPHPPSHADLFQALLDRGALLSEYGPGSAAIARNFPWRNRLVAALAHATVVTQAATNSGALHTARFALKCGRKLFTVPGPVDEPACAGSLELLVRGVPAMVGGPQLADLFFEVTGRLTASPPLPLAEASTAAVRVAELGEPQRRVLETLADGTSHVDDLVGILNMSHAALSRVLLELELNDWIVKKAGNHYTCKARLLR